jgi:hypothetical protein
MFRALLSMTAGDETLWAVNLTARSITAFISSKAPAVTVPTYELKFSF